jgi:hypothetical protein
VPSPRTAQAASSRGRPPRRRIAGETSLVIGGAGALTAWAGTRPSFDAYGWLTWGHMTLHGGLNTDAAPSWKPLPYVFTLVFGLFGEAAQWRLWMFTAIAVSLAGLVWAARLAARVAAPVAGETSGPGGAVAGAAAVVGLLCLRDELGNGLPHYVLSAQTDPMIVALLLGALVCRLGGRERTTFGLLVLAALGRPESWPFLVADGWWLWRRRPGLRPVLLAAPIVIGLLWFGIPALTSRSWFVAGDNAFGSGAAPTGNRALGALGRFVTQIPWPLGVAAVAMAMRGAARRDRLTGGLAAAVVVWMAIEVAFALHGWPALGRYMFEASALVVVLGAGLAGRLVATVATGAPRSLRGAAAAGAALVAGATIVVAVARAREARDDLLAQHARTASIDALARAVSRLGGPARVRRCGEAVSRGLGTQTVLAFDVGVNVDAVGYRWPQPGRPDDPVVLFTPRGRGWSVRSHRARSASCRDLRAGVR